MDYAALAWVLLGAAGMATLCHALRLPIVLGFITTGILLGPHSFNLLGAPASLNFMAQVGLICLLFMVGLEMAPAKLKAFKQMAFKAGLLQVLTTATVLGTGLVLLGAPPLVAVLLGTIGALSSTALVLKSLEDQHEMETAAGRLTMGTLVVQDMAAIPLMALAPLLTATAAVGTSQPQGPLAIVAFALFKTLVVLAGMAWLCSKLVPYLVDKLAHTGNRELFTVAVFGLGFGFSVLLGAMNLSAEAGAFIAGLSISASPYSRQILADTRPFRDVFATLFFVSLGALLPIDTWPHQWPWMLGGVALLLLAKGCAVAVAFRAAKASWYHSVLSALCLVQVGELGFMLVRKCTQSLAAAGTAPLPNGFAWLQQHEALLSNIIGLSLILTPLLIKAALSQRCKHWVERWTAPWDHRELKKATTNHNNTSPAAPLSNPNATPRVIMVGFGPIGRQLSEVFTQQGWAYQVIETNPHNVKNLQQLGVPVFYGDATRPEVLKASAIEQADLLVITMSHTKTSQLLLQRALELNPTLATVARARYHGDVTLLYDAGASLVVYDEMESGVRFVSQTLSHLGASLQEAHTLALLARDGFEEQYHPKSGLMQRLQEHGRLTLLGDLQLEWVAVHPNGPLKGHSLEALGLRQRFGINVLCLFDAVSGDRHSVLPQRPLQPKDRLLVVGAHPQLQSLQAWLNDADQADTTEPIELAY